MATTAKTGWRKVKVVQAELNRTNEFEFSENRDTRMQTNYRASKQTTYAVSLGNVSLARSSLILLTLHDNGNDLLYCVVRLA